MEDIVNRLSAILPSITILPGESLHWSPELKQITYLEENTNENTWGLLHEVGHAQLGHTSYSTDMELLQLEAAAWESALVIGQQMGTEIDHDHIQDCLDTYRDWLHQRSTCPRCGVVTFQETVTAYRCFNCNKVWSVTSSRFCRPYRRATDILKNRPETIPQTVFQNSL